nr:NUDIX domain-containing protein [Lactococcus fujiensis]
MINVAIARPLITITNVIWCYDSLSQKIKVLLVKREDRPFEEYWALPETFLRDNENARTASLRLVKERIGLDLPEIHAEQLATFTAPSRNPDGRAISLSYMIFLPECTNLIVGPGAVDVAWFDLVYVKNKHFEFINDNLRFTTLDDNEYITIEDSTKRLAFDHNWILTVACNRIINKLDYQHDIVNLRSFFYFERGSSYF